MWERVYWRDGKYKKALIANLYYDRDTGNYRITIQLGKDNKLTIYSKGKTEILKVIADIIDIGEDFIREIELIDKVFNNKSNKQ